MAHCALIRFYLAIMPSLSRVEVASSVGLGKSSQHLEWCPSLPAPYFLQRDMGHIREMLEILTTM